MKISVQSDGVSSSEVFRLVWQGWFIGVIAIFLPVLLLFGLTIVIPGYYNAPRPLEYFLGILLLPLIAAVQAVIVGAVVCLGLKFRPSRKSLGS